LRGEMVGGGGRRGEKGRVRGGNREKERDGGKGGKGGDRGGGGVGEVKGGSRVWRGWAGGRWTWRKLGKGGRGGRGGVIRWRREGFTWGKKKGIKEMSEGG